MSILGRTAMRIQSVLIRCISRIVFVLLGSGISAILVLPGIALADHTSYINDAGVEYRIEPSQGEVDITTYPALSDSCNTCIELFVDGLSAGTDTHDNTLATNSVPFNLGRKNDGVHYFQGALDRGKRQSLK